MTAYELAANIWNNSYCEHGYRMDITEATRLLTEYKYADENGELNGITAAELADAFNELQTECDR